MKNLKSEEDELHNLQAQLKQLNTMKDTTESADYDKILAGKSGAGMDALKSMSMGKDSSLGALESSLDASLGSSQGSSLGSSLGATDPLLSLENPKSKEYMDLLKSSHPKLPEELMGSSKDPNDIKTFMSSLSKIAAGDENAKESISSPLKLDTKTSSYLSSSLSKEESNYVKADKALIKTLLSKKILQNLPLEVRNLIKSYKKTYRLNETIDNYDSSAYFEANNVTASPSSQPFVDNLGKVGRRGFLTVIDTKTLSSKSVWTVMNSKVFCIYSSEVEIYSIRI